MTEGAGVIHPALPQLVRRLVATRLKLETQGQITIMLLSAMMIMLAPVLFRVTLRLPLILFPRLQLVFIPMIKLILMILQALQP